MSNTVAPSARIDIEATLNKMIAQETSEALEMEFSEAELLGKPTCKTVEQQIFSVAVNESSLFTPRIPNKEIANAISLSTTA